MASRIRAGRSASEFNFSARLLTSLLSLLLCGLTAAQSFGRFGYSALPAVPGFAISKEGFRVKVESADQIYFPVAPDEWKVTSTTPVEQVFDLGKSGTCDQLKVNLYSPGFLLHFPKGFSLKLRTNLAPYLSWTEASVGSGVPTPNLKWVGVSFQDNQPPIVLGFVDGEVSLQCDGKVADWTIHSTNNFSGWVRVALPIGTQSFATATAATLGQFSMATAASGSVWSQPAPELKDFELRDDDTALEATWTFDQPNVVVPVGAALANLGDYPLSIKSVTRRLSGYTEEGPTTICTDSKLIMRFPMERIPLGRSITAGPAAPSDVGTVSGFDVPGVTELAMQNLMASRDMLTRKAAEETVRGFIEQASYSLEPFTAQQLPFAPDGKGIDQAAAIALLYASYSSSSKSSSADNSLLTSVNWRRDWYTWRLWVEDQKLQRRAGALNALAAALCPEPIRRLDGAMAQAGLAAERGLAIFFSRLQHKIEDPTIVETLFEVRNSIFEMTQQPRIPSRFADTILGGLRIYGDLPVSCESKEGKYVLTWKGDEAPSGFTLASAFPVIVDSASVTNWSVSSFLGYTRFDYQSASSGDNTLTFHLADAAESLPVSAPPEKWSEGLR